MVSAIGTSRAASHPCEISASCSSGIENTGPLCPSDHEPAESEELEEDSEDEPLSNADGLSEAHLTTLANVPWDQHNGFESPPLIELYRPPIG